MTTTKFYMTSQKPIISIIVALDEKRGIGRDNALMWKIPGELARFKEITIGHPIIMGRKTFESIGRVLPGRTNIIVTRDVTYNVEGAVVVDSVEKGLEIANKDEEIKKNPVIAIPTSREKQSQGDGIAAVAESSLAVTKKDSEIFIIGGGQIFEQALPLVDRLYLTLVKGDFYADVFFPDYSDFTKELHREDKVVDEYSFSFVTLER